jgi:hypothetical protein
MGTATVGFPRPKWAGSGAALVLATLTGGLSGSRAAAPAEVLPAVPAVGPYWRELYPKRPPDLRLETGPWCRFCDGQLQVSKDGWRCLAPECRAAWDFTGRHGWWLPGGTR